MTKNFNESFVEYGHRLKLKFDRWLNSLNLKSNYEALRQVFLIEEFKKSLSVEALLYVKQNQCVSVVEMPRAVD